MTCYNPGCLGNYDFDKIALFARKRFIEGCDTIELMAGAASDREKQEIALVAMLDLNDTTITELELDCIHAATCKVTSCRNMLREMIRQGIAAKNSAAT